MINDVRNTVLSRINKDNNGYLTPDEFNYYAKQAQIEIFKGYYADYSRAVLKRNKRLHNSGYGDLAKRAEEVIGRFITTGALDWSATALTYVIPSNSYWTENVEYNDASPVEIVTAAKARQLRGLLDAAPSTDYPIGVIKDNTDIVNYPNSEKMIKVYPTTITGAGLITADYIRFPADPKWTYTGLSGGEPVFNQGASDYQDFELPLDDFDNLVNKILISLGVEIREPEVVQASKNEEITEKQDNQ